jgi:valyl-tRNA synthetase
MHELQWGHLAYFCVQCVISGHFINFDVQQCQANRLFCNKIWQVSRYTRMCLERLPAAFDSDLESSRDDLSKLDKWILSRLASMVSEVNKALGASDLHIATSALKTFLYSEFCDFYIVRKYMFRHMNHHHSY